MPTQGSSFTSFMIVGSLLLLFLGMVRPAVAEPVSLATVISKVLSSHPDLVISRIDAAITGTEIDSIEGKLDPTFSTKITASRDRTPVASDFQPSGSDQVDFGTNISKPLANGGTLEADLSINRNDLSFASPFASSLAKINPEYRGSFTLNYRHPLLRGAGRPDYTLGLKAAKADSQASVWQQNIIARDLALRALNAYYQLVADTLHIKLAQHSVDRAKELVRYQKFRERLGLIERADRLQVQALLEARKLDLAEALARFDSDRTILNRLMLQNPSQPIEPEIEQTAEVTGDAGQFDQLVMQASRHRPEFRQLDQQLDAATARLKQAQDDLRRQLDLVAKAGTRSLDAAGGGAVSGLFNIQDHYVALSLEFGETIGNKTARAAVQKAELQRQRIMEEKRRQLEQVRNDIANALSARNGSARTLRQARARANAEKRKFNMELQRYREGRSDTATLIQFETELQAAETEVQLQTVNLMLAEKQLAWAQGLFLKHLGITVNTRAATE